MPAPPPSADRRLSEEIEAVLEISSRGRALRVGEVAAMLESRGFALLTMLLAAPFLIPSVPGLSTPFGAAIMALGGGLALGREPWLPAFVLRRELSSETWGKILRALLWLVRRMERAARPRLLFLREGPGMTRWIGAAIVSGGVFLFLPIMVPVMNTLPTLSILFLAAGLMERDGLFVALGHFFGVAAWIYMGAWIWLGKAGFDCLHNLNWFPL